MAHPTTSYAQFHIETSARAARRAHALVAQSSAAVYVYYRPMEIAAFRDGEEPSGEGWTLAWPERVPYGFADDEIVEWFARRSGSLPYLNS